MTQENRPLLQQETTEIHITLPGVIFPNDPATIAVPEHLNGEPFEDILAAQVILSELAAFIDPNYEMMILRTLLFETTNDNKELVTKRTIISRKFRYVNGSVILL